MSRVVYSPALGGSLVSRHYIVHSDFIAIHRSTSADAILSQQLCALRIFVRVTWAATQKTSVGRRRSMHNDKSLTAPYLAISFFLTEEISLVMNVLGKKVRL